MPANVSPHPERELAVVLADALRRAGWKVEQEPAPPSAGYRPDLVASKGGSVFAIELKVASEARRDRLIPLFAQAILEASAVSRHGGRPARPLAVIASRRLPESIVEQLQRYAGNFAPDLAFGLIDAGGFRYFSDPALIGLNAVPRAGQRHPVPAHRRPDLFSDLNQWMLKVLLAPRIPEGLLSAPRVPLRNASELARAANVSVMSAFRLVSLLQEGHFLDADHEGLRVVRIEELMLRWQAANLRAEREIPARWILGGGPDRLDDALRAQAQGRAEPGARNRRARPPVRMCLGLFAAADRLGLGFVHGAIPHLYVERVAPEVLRGLGLSFAQPGDAADVFLRIPSRPESVFRAAARVNDVPVSDVLQVWLDVQAHPARGRQQAREIRRRVLRPLFSVKKK